MTSARLRTRTAAQLEAGWRQGIARMHAAGLRVLQGTLARRLAAPTAHTAPVPQIKYASSSTPGSVRGVRPMA